MKVVHRRIPFFQKCEAKCSRFTPKMNSYRSPVSEKVVICSCPVLPALVICSCPLLREWLQIRHQIIWDRPGWRDSGVFGGEDLAFYSDYGWSSFSDQGSVPKSS